MFGRIGIYGLTESNPFSVTNYTREPMSDFLPIRTACNCVGGLLSLSRHLDVAAPVVHKWATGKQSVPIIRCVESERDSDTPAHAPETAVTQQVATALCNSGC